MKTDHGTKEVNLEMPQCLQSERIIDIKASQFQIKPLAKIQTNIRDDVSFNINKQDKPL